MLAVGDGSVTHHLPVDEIEHVAAAGYYVEIAWKGQRLLHRTTLSAIEAELAGAGFARIHRSRLARKAAIRRVVTQKSGDFDVEMDSGEALRGRRRYRPKTEGRSEERRGGTGGVSRCRSRWAPDHYKKKKNQKYI